MSAVEFTRPFIIPSSY